MTSLNGVANLADSFFMRNGGLPSWQYEEWLDDGYAVHAPVGSYRSNAFGLHDVHGNVFELCLNTSIQSDAPSVNGRERSSKVYRGGSFYYTAAFARLAFRGFAGKELRSSNFGVRPVRRVN